MDFGPRVITPGFVALGRKTQLGKGNFVVRGMVAIRSPQGAGDRIRLIRTRSHSLIQKNFLACKLTAAEKNPAPLAGSSSPVATLQIRKCQRRNFEL